MLIGLTACSGDFQPDICMFVNLDTAQCNPTDPFKSKYDLKANQMLGYRCLSPDDRTEGKKRLRRATEGAL